MLDQPVPNPLAKNPNFNTHKVFAAIGLILIAIILIGGGIWYFVQSAQDKAGTVGDNIVTKTATSSAKTASSSTVTADWKTYTNSDLNLSFKLPRELLQGNSDSGTDVATGLFYILRFSNYPNQNGESICSGKPDCYLIQMSKFIPPPDGDQIAEDEFVKSLKVGESKSREKSSSLGSENLTYTRTVDFKFDNNLSTTFSIDGGKLTIANNNKVVLLKKNDTYYKIEFGVSNKDVLNKNESLFNQILSTFKFL